ncbi:hypothetical protein FBU31_002218 [Coemansia sp. 'formosensis']|nr:hypothetical protein FBU31_002218 [Coemansia sp. 'formosensis']
MSALEEATRRRKERLREMFSAQQKTDSTDAATIPTSEDTSNTVLTVEESVNGIVENTLATQREESQRTDLDIAAIAPKRANWDLKRDLQKQLDVLKPLNDAAIADLVRKRVQASTDADGLADAVEAHVRSAQL